MINLGLMPGSGASGINDDSSTILPFAGNLTSANSGLKVAIILNNVRGSLADKLMMASKLLMATSVWLSSKL